MIEISNHSRGIKLGGIEVQILCFKLYLTTEALKMEKYFLTKLQQLATTICKRFVAKITAIGSQ